MRDPTNAPSDVDGVLPFQGHGDSPLFFYLLYVRQDKTFRQVHQNYSRTQIGIAYLTNTDFYRS